MFDPLAVAFERRGPVEFVHRRVERPVRLPKNEGLAKCLKVR
jgi:hypothetical protein